MNEKPVMTKFANSVSDLCRVIDLRIDDKDYSSARVLISDMETFLKKIVSAMLLHDDIDTRESDLFLTFIRRIVADKRTIIMEKEKNRYLESKKDDSFFEQEEASWKEYITPPADEESHQADSDSRSKKKWVDDDDEDDL
jgi:hypothetical protein